jgi:phage terminase large subunit-like protein
MQGTCAGGLYDLLDAGVDPADVEAWLVGQHVADLPDLSPRERARVAGSWWFMARPGQRWVPGPEFITDIRAGRGFGKTATGSNAILDASAEPDKWGGYAIIAGADPTAVESDMLSGPSGILTLGRARERLGDGPGFTYNPSKLKITFEAVRGGGGGGLTVLLRASSKPHSGRGPHVGLLWGDEFGVWYHRMRDEQGTNLWEAIRPAVRNANGLARIIFTQTPSFTPEVAALARDAERPPCATCRERYVEESGPWLGPEGEEPWRLPPDPRPLVHPLFRTRSTTPIRECPLCGSRVVAEVRQVTGSTLDNDAHLAREATAAAKRAIDSGTVAARAEFEPNGEADQGPRGAPVRLENVRRLPVAVAPSRRDDPWLAVLDSLGALEKIVQVDPAVTSGPRSADSGVVAACRRRTADAATEENPDPVAWDQVVGLEDASVRPEEVKGAPSSVWAPRAYWLALRWQAPRIVVETNNGGDEVLASLLALVDDPADEESCLAHLRGWWKDHGRQLGLCPADHALRPAARRMSETAAILRVEAITRQADKRPRFEWYGASADRGEQGLAEMPWLGGARGWSVVMAQLRYDPPPDDGSGKKDGRTNLRDRADVLIGAAQVLLGVREVRGQVEPARPGGAESWLMGADASIFRD